MSHPDPLQDYDDEDMRYWQEVGQWEQLDWFKERIAYQRETERRSREARKRWLEYMEKL